MVCEVYYPEDDEPVVKNGILYNINQEKKFNTPFPEDNPVVKDLLSKAKSFFELTGIKNTITFKGPFTDSGFIRGQTDFLLDIVDNPVLCEELILKVTDAAIEWKKYYDSEIGIEDSDTIALIDDLIANIDPKIFEKIVLPHLLRWFEAFPAPERHFHCCGNINNFFEQLKKIKLSTYDFMGEMVDLEKAK